MTATVLFFLATLVATSLATCLSNPIRLPGDTTLDLEGCIPNPIHVPRPKSEPEGLSLNQINCRSWRLAVETNNLQNWPTIPTNCVVYVALYMLGGQYHEDSEVIADIAIEYAKNVTLSGDGMDIWVFGIGETALSNLPYYARLDVLYGAFPYNSTKFNEWVAEGRSPAVPAMLRLYNKLYELGFKVVFLTGIHEHQRHALASNLKDVGYTTWEKLILKEIDEHGLGPAEYKSKKRTELVEKGYRIIGNIGDQWSDLTGKNAGRRTFKVPNPMYFVF